MRVCPNCKAVINDPNAFFCYKCGSRIESDETISQPDTLEINTAKKQEEKGSGDDKNSLTSLASTDRTIKPDISSVKHATQKEDEKMKKKWTYFVVGANALALFFVLFSVGVFFRYSAKDNLQVATSPLVDISTVEVSYPSLEDFKTPVLRSNYYSIVPQKPLFYSEGSNLKGFVDQLLTDKDKEYLEKTYELPVSDLLVFLRPDFAYVKSSKDNFALITQADSSDFFDRTYSKYQENKTADAPLYTVRVGKYLVFAKDSSYLDLMGDVLNGTYLPLEKDASFIDKANSVKGTPVFFVHSSSKEFLDSNLEQILGLYGLADLKYDFYKNEFTTFTIVKEGDSFLLYTID